jgi:hypothetical protein
MDNLPPTDENKPEKPLMQGEGIDTNLLAKIVAEKVSSALQQAQAIAPGAGSSAQMRELQAELETYTKDDPDAVQEAVRLYKAKHANLLIKITLQQLYRLFKGKEKRYVRGRRMKRVGQAVNLYCRGYGPATEELDANGNRKHDVDLGDVTHERLDEFASRLPADRAAAEISGLRKLLAFAVKAGYLAENPATGIARRLTIQEKEELARKDIAVDSNEELQIALDTAAAFPGGSSGKPGGLVWMVVMRYFGKLRPESEMPNLEPDKIQEDGGFRVFSTKKLRTLGKDLPANAMVMLNYYWPDRKMDTTGWRQLWALIRTAQNNYLRDKGKKVPSKRYNRPRHTGCAHARFLKKERKQFLKEDDHDERNFEGAYNGLSPRNKAVQFFGQYPHSMPLSKEFVERIRAYLVENEFTKLGDPLPALPDVQKYIPEFTKKILWKPTIPLNELRDLIFASGMEKAAEKLGTNTPWLSAMCRALRVPVPPAGRSKARAHPENGQIPPPLTNESDEEIAQTIREEHGVAPAAKKLRIRPLHLYAWCVVRGIRVPRLSELMVHYNNRERVRAHREEVRRLLKKDGLEDVAKHLEVSVRCLEDFCERHAIIFFHCPPPPPPPPPGIVEQIKRELALNARRPRDEDEAMAWVLSRGTGELKESELASAFEAAFGLRVTTATIAQIADQNPARYEHRLGIVRLVGHYRAELDMAVVKIQLASIARTMTQCSLPDAVRHALALTFGGLAFEQLSELIPIFGLALDPKELHQELKRLDRQHRLNFTHGRVTASEVQFDFRRRVRDREPTPGFAQICKQVKETYEGIVEQPLTNVEKLRLILHEAPNGLWQEEIALVAANAGIDLEESAIECVPGHEGKGEMRRNNGRVAMTIDKHILVKKSQLKAALAGTKHLDRTGLVLKLLEASPAGLNMHELAWACRENGDVVSTESLRRWMYNHQGPNLNVQEGRVSLAPPAQNGTASSGQVDGAPGVGPDIAS